MIDIYIYIYIYDMLIVWFRYVFRTLELCAIVLLLLFFFLKCDLIFQEENRGYKEDSVKQKYAANQIEQQELKKEG